MLTPAAVPISSPVNRAIPTIPEYINLQILSLYYISKISVINTRHIKVGSPLKSKKISLNTLVVKFAFFFILIISLLFNFCAPYFFPAAISKDYYFRKIHTPAVIQLCLNTYINQIQVCFSRGFDSNFVFFIDRIRVIYTRTRHPVHKCANYTVQPCNKENY